MDNAYDFVLADSGIISARHSSSDLEAGLYSLLAVLSAKDDAEFSGSTPASAYAHVESRLRALSVNPWILSRYLQTVAGRVSFHSR